MKNKFFKILFSNALLLLLIIKTTGQVQTIQIADSLKSKGLYIEAIDSYNFLISNQDSINYCRYQIACINSLLGKNDSAFNNLYLCIQNGASAENIMTDTDFLNLYDDPRWDSVKHCIAQQYLFQNLNITNKELAIELYFLGIEDQRFRTLRKNYKLKDKPSKQTVYKFQTYYFREERLNQIIDQFGWPVISMVGEEASEAAFLIAQHSNYKTLKRACKLMSSVYQSNKNEVDSRHVALIIDRKRVYRGRRQIYGTQLDQKYKYIDGKFTPVGELMFDPIKKKKKVNERRSDMGLIPIEEYAKSFGIEYMCKRKFLFFTY